MKIKALTAIICTNIFLIALNANSETINSRNARITASALEDNENQIKQQAKEIQSLLGRVEVLEHSNAVLQERIDLIDRMIGKLETSSTYSRSVADDGSKSNIVSHNDLATSKDDIFELSGDTIEAPRPEQVVVSTKAAASLEDSKDKKLYDQALIALKDNNFSAAEEKFSTFIRTYPQSLLQSNAYFWYGETFFRRNMFDKAAPNYLKGYKLFPKGVKAADSLLKLALSLNELKKKTEACGILTKLENEFPSRPAASIKRAKDAAIKFGCK